MTLRKSTSAALLVGALALGACGGPTNARPRTPTTASVGEVGQLPPPAAPRPGPRLVVPRPALSVPGRYRLDQLVAFRVPVRNDGNRVLRITKIDPG